jgi:tetratricopeptide (TPR) repeat protein
MLDRPPASLAGRALVCLLLAFTLYGVGLANGFTYDDHPYLERNERIRSLDGVAYLAFHPLEEGETLRGQLYRPLAALVQWLLGTLFGFTPLTFHVANIVLYAALALLLYAALVRLLASGTAWLATLLFLAHPVHTEAAASAVGSTEMLAALGALAACWLAWRTPSTPRTLALAGVAMLAALLAKETAILMPLVAALGGWLQGRPRRDVLLTLVALCVPVFLYFGLRYQVVGSFLAAPQVQIAPLDNPLVELPALERAQHGLLLLARYAGLLLWPATLSADYSLAAIPLSRAAWPWLAALALHAGLLVLAWVRRSKAPAWLLGAAFFYLGLLPVANVLFAGGTLFGERFLLLPALGVVLPVAWGLAQLAEASPARRRWVLGALAVLLLAGGVRTVARVGDWRDDLTLFRSAVEAYPQNAKANYNVAVLLQKAGEHAEALLHAERAVAIYPAYGDARVVLAQLLLDAGPPGRALDVLREGVAATPRHEDLWVQLGQLHLRHGEVEAAGRAFAEGSAHLPASFGLAYNAAMVELELGHLDAAEPRLRRALELTELPDLHYPLGTIELARGDTAAALASFRRAFGSQRWGGAARVHAALAELELGHPRAAFELVAGMPGPEAAIVAAAALARGGERTRAAGVLSSVGLAETSACPPEIQPHGALCRQLVAELGPP